MRDVKPALIFRTAVPGRAFAAMNADNPAAALAVAMRRPDGWTVATAGGRVVADRLDQRKAKALMLRTATTAAGALTRPLLSTAPAAAARPVEVTGCPF
ncbi:hypothetical protein ACN27G_27485 [Plantactinospora sp. WMMB334]|uniref:hypothetical protein n=1 Tax=Plantactinospora sp. WMMB334 TaxID=3404119 RepID=UPI003B926029